MTTGFRLNNILEHKRADGYLIYYWESKKVRSDKYERWRSEVCHRNRDKKLWLPFRQGKFNILILIYALYLKLTRR